MNLRWHVGLMILLPGGGPFSHAADDIRDASWAGTLPEPPARREIWPERGSPRVGSGDLFDSRPAEVRRRDEAGDTAAGRQSSGVPPLALVETESDRGRVRLVGHTGAGRSLRGIFALPDGRSVLARSGEALGTEGLVVRSMELRRVRGEPATVRRARAVLERALSGETLTLDAEENQTQDGGLRALLRLLPGGETRQVRQGDRFVHAGLTFQVGPVTSPPGRVEVSWSDHAGETCNAILLVSPEREPGRGKPNSR